jgi:fluoride exporter
MTISLALLLKALWTGLAGACGAGARHSIATASRHQYGDRFPWGTLWINLSGALIIGIFSAALAHHHALGAWHAPIVLGFLGGYTTFSSLMLDAAHLRARRDHHFYVAYLAATLILGPLCAFAGLLIGGQL